MQNETQKTTTAATFGRSSIARLPPELREAVDAAIADGATIDEITALIRGEGGACSRSAVGRYTKNVRDLIRQQQEADRANEAWVRALGERAQGPRGSHPGRDPADDDALHPRPNSASERSPRRRKSSPVSRSFSSASKAPTSSVSSGSARRPRRRRRRQPGPRPARARRRSGRASRPRPSPPSARPSRGGPARPSGPSHRRRSTPGILRNPT